MSAFDSVRRPSQSEATPAFVTAARNNSQQGGSASLQKSVSFRPPEEPARGPEEPEAARSTVLWHKAFLKIKDDGQVHHDDLGQALELAGFARPDADCVEDAFGEVSEQFTTLDEEQFVEFVRQYTRRLDTSYTEAFRRCDQDGSGTVEVTELAEMLAEFGIEPMRHVLDEVLSEVDEDCSGQLSLGEFKQVMEILRVRGGFSRAEYQEFQDLFRKFDQKKTGEIDAKELANILLWIGYSIERERTEAIIKEVDANDSGSIHMGELLVCMRRVREEEIKTIREVVALNDDDHTGTISMQELPEVLKALGYVPDMDVVTEAATELNVDPERCELDISDLCRLVAVFRKREGFLTSELADISVAFAKFDKAKIGEINVMDVGRVLRWLGYLTSFEVQQQLIKKVDIDASGMINEAELRKLLRMTHGKELEEVKEVFELYDQEGEGVLDLDDAAEALRELRCSDDRGEVPEIQPEDRSERKGRAHERRGSAQEPLEGVNLKAFQHIFVRFQREAKRTFRNNGGFSLDEIAELRGRFDYYDKDGSGDIGNKELVALIEEIFPAQARDPALRPRLRQVISEVDRDASGSLDFRDFIQLMERLREMQAKDHQAKEQKAIEATGFSPKEVDEFRELFLANGDHSSTVSFAELKVLISSICPLGDKNKSELVAHVETVTGRSAKTGGAGDHSAGLLQGRKSIRKSSVLAAQMNEHQGVDLDFPEFLLLMNRLMEVNFADLQSRIGG